METVDELCQDTQKFHNYQRNSARQQQQKDSYNQKRASIYTLYVVCCVGRIDTNSKYKKVGVLPIRIV